MATTSGAGRALRRLVITLIVLILVLVAVDRVGVYVAERTAANTIQTSQKLASKPGVDIAGFPFLTQLAAGAFDQITLSAHNVPVGQKGVALSLDSIRVVLSGVTVSRDFSRVHANTATATATIGYGPLSSALGATVSYSGNGKITARKTITLFGQTVTPSVTAAPELVNGALGFTSAQINDLNGLSGQTSQILQRVFDVSVPLNGIPFDVRVQALSFDASGLVVQLAGSNLTYTKTKQI